MKSTFAILAAALTVALCLAACDRRPVTPPTSPVPEPQVSTDTAAPTQAGPEPSKVRVDEPAEPTAAPQPVEIGGIRNVHRVAGCYTAGAPTEADFKLLADRGVKAVINLAEPAESKFDEAAAAQAAGLRYVSIPFSKPDTLTDAVFDRFRATMKELGDADVFIHCGSANRVGAVWMAKRALDDGLTPQAALAEAKTIGLHTGALIDKANDYIARHRVEGD